MPKQAQVCCSSPAAMFYWFAASLLAWGSLSFVGAYWHPLWAFSAQTILLAISIGCIANWCKNRTLHCSLTGPVFLIAGILFLLGNLKVVKVSSDVIWGLVAIGAGTAFALEGRLARKGCKLP
ncbi:MAG TPA: hypothetical protein VGK64_08880 [Bryobacteraceae bacterium]